MVCNQLGQVMHDNLVHVNQNIFIIRFQFLTFTNQIRKTIFSGKEKQE